MRIESIKAKNFKSFLPEGIQYKVQHGLNTIVGENNVGKSNIIKILSELIALLNSQNRFDITHAFQGNVDNDVELEISAVLDDNDITFLMRRFNVPLSYKEEFLKIFGKDVTVQFTFSRFVGSKITIKFGNIMFINGKGMTDKTQYGRSYRARHWANLVNDVSQNKLSLLEEVTKQLAEAHSTPSILEFNQNPNDFFHELFNEKIIIFPEFRERPTAEVKMGVFLSPLGREVASVLFNLKNGGIEKRKKFEQIQDHFSQIFPNLKLDVRQGHQIVVVKDNDYEVEQDSIGAGIIEIIILLTHLVDTQLHVFALDEPELHLHPHAKRSISNLIRNSSKLNQIICVTHSTNFIHIDSINSMTHVTDKEGHTEIITLPDDYFTKDEINKLKRITESRQKEFLFARAVLVVEGDTEVGAMPIFAKKIGNDLDMRNISVIGIDSHYFALFVKLLRGFKIPYLVMLDADTLSHVDASLAWGDSKIRTSSLIKQLDYLGELAHSERIIVYSCDKGIITDKNGSSRYDNTSIKKLRKIIKRKRFINLLPSDFEGLFAETKYQNSIKAARKNFRGNKVLQGRHIAENLLEFPMDLTKVIKKVSVLATL